LTRPFLCAEEVLILAKDKEAMAARLESLQTKLREAEDNVNQLKGALFSKETAITEMKGRLESPLRKVVETLSSKSLVSLTPFF
jgi:predicted  nucleic acid-binding Zn-ribbon protein